MELLYAETEKCIEENDILLECENKPLPVIKQIPRHQLKQEVQLIPKHKIKNKLEHFILIIAVILIVLGSSIMIYATRNSNNENNKSYYFLNLFI